MAIIQGSTSLNGAEVDTDNHIFTQARPPAFGPYGYYRESVPTGAIAATLAASSTLLSFRWTDATRLAIVQSVRVSAIVTSAITTAVPFDLALFFARSFTASDTGGTAITPTSTGQKLRTSMGSSLVGDFRVASTATLTPGTRTLDAQPIDRIQGFSGTALGTNVFGNGAGPLPLFVIETDGDHPLVLAQNEGFVIQNPLAGPATGTITLLFRVRWGEVAKY
jgi:hypothetical protein